MTMKVYPLNSLYSGELKQVFTPVEILGIKQFLSLWIKDDTEQFLGLSYEPTREYAKLQYDFEVNEGFYINEHEMIDHIALNNDGMPILFTVTNDDDVNVYSIELDEEQMEEILL